MSEEPKTARAAMMIDMEGDRLARRDRALAISIGRQMVEQYFHPLGIEDMRDVREQISRATEHAAYEAIQQERKYHAEDMKMLRSWGEARFSELMLNPKVPFVPTP